MSCTEGNCEELAAEILDLVEFVDPSRECGCEEERALRERSRVLLAHAAQCGHCTEVVEAEQRLREVLRDACSEPAPRGLREVIVERVRAQVRGTDA